MQSLMTSASQSPFLIESPSMRSFQSLLWIECKSMNLSIFCKWRTNEMWVVMQSASFHGAICVIFTRKIWHITRWIALNHSTFHYQSRHAQNCFISQLRWYCAIIPMNEFCIINFLTMQLGTSCSFDSPGLARNEPTPGQRLQGDSTP